MNKLNTAQFNSSFGEFPDDGRIYYVDYFWQAHCKNGVLANPDGATDYPELQTLLSVLAGIGIRRIDIEWDGLSELTYPNGAYATQEGTAGRNAGKEPNIIGGHHLPNTHAVRKSGRPPVADFGHSASVAAIQFALSADEGLAFLRLWNEGEFASCRKEWPEAGEECYRGADPLMGFVENHEPPVSDIAENIVTKWGLLGNDHAQAVDDLSTALERERSRAIA